MFLFFFFKQKTAYEMRISDWSSDVCSSDLSGTINKSIVSALNAAGGRAVGLSGKDGNLIQARKLTRTTRDPDSHIEKVLDLGFVGEPTMIHPTILAPLQHSDIIPIIAPIGLGPDGPTYHIKHDTVACPTTP